MTLGDPEKLESYLKVLEKYELPDGLDSGGLAEIEARRSSVKLTNSQWAAK